MGILIRIVLAVAVVLSLLLLMGVGYGIGYDDGYECGVYDTSAHIAEKVPFGLVESPEYDRPDHCRTDIFNDRAG